MMPSSSLAPRPAWGVEALVRPLAVGVAARDPVRAADFAARVVLAGHAVAGPGPAEIMLADAEMPVAPGTPVLRLGRPAEERDGVLPPDLSPLQLDAALRAVAAGLRVSLPAPAPATPEQPPLTPRELEILGCLGEGQSNKEVARSLGISAHTVKFHLEAVFAKLSATSRAEAVAKGLRRGLIRMA